MSPKSLSRMSLFAAVTAVCSLLSFPIPFSPVPLSLSLLAVFLTGALLDPKSAAGAQIVYLALGLVGVPVFTGFQAGPGRLFGPTGGYLVAYPLMAWGIAFLGARFGRGLWRMALSMAAALGLCYLLGTVWLMALTGSGLWAALGMAVLPFIPLDLVKIALAALLGAQLCRRGFPGLPSVQGER